MPNKFDALLILKEWRQVCKKSDLSNPFSRKIPLRQGTNGSSRHHFCLLKARGVRGGTTEKGLMSDGSARGDFYRKQLLFSFKKRNKQSAYGTGTAGNKVKCDNGHTTVNVWI